MSELRFFLSEEKRRLVMAESFTEPVTGELPQSWRRFSVSGSCQSLRAGHSCVRLGLGASHRPPSAPLRHCPKPHHL